MRNRHKSIIKECQTRPERDLTEEEEIFISSRGGFVALELIEETVKRIMGKELEKYLNSDLATRRTARSIPGAA